MKTLAVFASGSGTNFEALAQACADGRLDARIALMVCDKPGAAVIDRARRFGIESFVASPKEFPSKADYEREIVRRLDAAGVDLVCLAGYMRLVADTLLNAYRGRIINIHPSLLPAFKGAHAVEDAVAYGVKVYGITIHYVDESLDGGKIIAQRAFAYDGNDPAEVHRLGQVIEHQLYVETVQKLITSL
ncbi:MAG: phosphoribosylglycinamide formyltransferase [Bacteroidales bacterium]|nr:phosphoribosylglycinamide formyltransferase [Bacteroidales bacterium]MCR5115753.1 phosphoribosylglycinamide formyltransferase [Bacteroidales bacterium]